MKRLARVFGRTVLVVMTVGLVAQQDTRAGRAACVSTALATEAPPGPAASFPLQAIAGRRVLSDRDGRPFMIVGDAGWSMLAQLSSQDARLYLSDRRARGFNTVVVELIEHKFALRAPANLAGDRPFLGSQPFEAPNPAYFSHVDAVLEEARRLGLLVLLSPAFLGFDGGDEGWYQEMRQAGAERLRAYGRFLGRRYRAFDNIVWLEAGDFNPPERALVEALADGIAKEDPAALHAAHPGPETLGSDTWGHARWLALDTLYTYRSVAEQARRAFQARPTRPFILLESAYENEHGVDTQTIRQQAYEAVLGGATGQVFGNNPIWHFDGPGLYAIDDCWQAQLDSPGSRSMANLGRLMRAIDWSGLDPDLDERFLRGSADGAEAAPVAALSLNRRVGLVYAPAATVIQVRPSALGSEGFEARWFDPSSGRLAPAMRQAAADGEGWESYRTPGRNDEGAEDWVLLLLRPPGG